MFFLWHLWRRIRPWRGDRGKSLEVFGANAWWFRSQTPRGTHVFKSEKCKSYMHSRLSGTCTTLLKDRVFFGEMISQKSRTSISRECGHVTIWCNAMWCLYKQGQLSCLSCKTAGFGIFLEELKNAHGQLQALHGRLGNLEVRQCHPVPLNSCVSWHVATCHAVQDAGNPGRREGSSWRGLCRNCMGIDS